MMMMMIMCARACACLSACTDDTDTDDNFGIQTIFRGVPSTRRLFVVSNAAVNAPPWELDKSFKMLLFEVFLDLTDQSVSTGAFVLFF